jgi:hypothetical protein
MYSCPFLNKETKELLKFLKEAIPYGFKSQQLLKSMSFDFKQ